MNLHFQNYPVYHSSVIHLTIDCSDLNFTALPNSDLPIIHDPTHYCSPHSPHSPYSLYYLHFPYPSMHLAFY